VRYLERQLDLRRQLGKAVAIVGISAGLSALTGCGDKAKQVDNLSEDQSKLTDGKAAIDTIDRIDGDVEYRSPVDCVIIEKDPATIKKRTAPFEAPTTSQTKKDSATCEVEEHVLRIGEVVVDEVPAPDPKTNEVFGVVEQMPAFRGGDAALMKYLAENTHYPEEAKEKGVQGRVVVNFVVEKDGSITDVKVVRSIDPLLDKEAVRVVETMPKWIPGKQSLVPVRVGYVLPVSFKLP
jgi:TonB family protein